MKGKNPRLAGRGVAMLVVTALAFTSVGTLSAQAMTEDPGSMRQQLVDLTDQFEALSPIQQGSDDGRIAAGLIDDITSNVDAYDTEAAKTGHLTEQSAAAQAQAGLYAEGTVTRTVTSTGSIFKTFTATYTLSPDNPGGDLWRTKVGFGSGFTQVFTSTVLDTAGLTSTVGVYHTWQNTGTGAAKAALDIAYGSGYISTVTTANNAARDALNAVAINEIALSALENTIASQLIQLAEAIDNARILRFTNTVVSDQVAQDGTVHLSVKGDTMSIWLSFLTGFPAQEGTGADFSDYTWDVSLTGDDVVAYQVQGDSISLHSKPVLGTASISVTAVFTTTGMYTAEITPLTFDVTVIETLSFESSAVDASADSTHGAVVIPTPPVKNAIGSVDYQLVAITPAEPYGRVTFTSGAIRVAKEANAGTYDIVISAKDSKGYADQTTVSLTVTNAYDDLYAARLAQLQAIEAEIATLLSVAELFSSTGSDTLLTALRAFSAVSDPLEEMWADGKPVVNEQSIRGFTTALGAIGSINPAIKVGTDLTVGTLNGLSKYLGYLPLDKQTAMEGYTINLVFMKVNFPSVPKLYVDAVLAAWDIFQDQVTPVTGLINAYKDLYQFVIGTNYSTLKDLHSINDYVQTLYFKYAAFDTALNVFVTSKSFLVPVINALLGNVDNLVGLGLGLANSAGRPALHGVIDPLIDTYLPLPQLNRGLKSLVDRGFDLVMDAVGKSSQILPTNVSLKDVAAFSGKVKAGLGALARACAVTVSAVDFNYRGVLEYDYTKFSSWDEYAASIYDDYRATLAQACGPNATEFTAELDFHRDQILSDPRVVAALSVYQDASAAYDFLVGVVDYFSSGKAADNVTAAKQGLIAELNELWASAIINGQAAFASRVNAFIVEVRSAMPHDLAGLEATMNDMAQQLADLLAAAK